MVRGNFPLVSPFGLIQETLWPDEWKILIACMMLNCTSRKQVDAVAPKFFKNWPLPEVFLQADRQDIIDTCRPLGFANRRTENMVRMTKMYLENNWTHASELPGIGQYAARAWEIFCRGVLGEIPPVDHALVRYWQFCKHHKDCDDFLVKDNDQ